MEPIGCHIALALDVNAAPVFEHVAIAKFLVNRYRYLDAPCLPMGFHTAGDVDRISPQVVDKFFGANDPGHHRPRINSDADIEGLPLIRFELRNDLLHVESNVGDRLNVVISL